MISGSDRLSPQAAAAWTEFTGIRLLNAYGPTETVITATVHEVGGARTGGAAPIGRAVGDRVAHVLDERLRPVTDGAAGELYLGGAALATGYLSRPGETSLRFLPDPFAARPGERMYRTGDLVRRNADGDLEFLGRRDDQVKIRGFRVELGEIEVVLATHPAVQTCAVVAHGDRLAAYVTGRDGLSCTELQQFLGRSLPGHMIPATLTVLDALPLTPGGKVDRAALPAPAWPVNSARQAPRSPAEELLAGIWADVLGVPDVGMEDNFFHLGGDSLTAVRLASRVFEVFGPVSPYLVFDAPTLGEFAAALQHQRSGVAAADLSGPIPRPHLGTAPLSRFQRGLWLADCWEPDTSTYNVPWVFEFAGPLDAGLLGQALTLLVERHESLRTTFAVAGDGQPRQVIHQRMAVPLCHSDLSALPEGDRATCRDELIRRDAQRPFDLAAGPLLRARLMRESGRAATLVLVLHHLVWDEGSLTVLDRDLRELYDALQGNRPPRLPELAVQYADYTTWLHGLGETDRAGYWAAQLRGTPAAPVLQPDHCRPTWPTHEVGYHQFAFDPALAAQVREVARAADATPFMVLLAGLVLAVHRRTGRTDLIVGTPVSMRNRAELRDLIGFFINLLPLRFRVDGHPSVRDLLIHVREVALGGYQNQDVPFEQIADLVPAERSGGRHPLLQLVFEMHTADPHPAPFGGAALTRRLHVNELSRFDVSWSVEDDGIGFSGRIEYDRDLFDAATLAGLGADWMAMLAAALADPDAPLDLAAKPRTGSAGRPEPAADEHLHTLFERQVRRSPDAVALVSGSAEISYAELNARANRVARWLRDGGLPIGSLVAVAAERRVHVVAGLLGVLKAGAGYTLLEPGLPAERQDRVVSDSGARLMLTAEAIAAAAADPTVPADDLNQTVPAEATACVMFTSGSTGRPKGVAAAHRALAATYLGQDYATFGPGEVWLQCSPVSWDAFALELFGALLFGGTCVLHPGQRPDPQTVAELVRRHRVTQLQLSASLFNFLVDELPATFEALTTVFTGGERASVAHVAKAAAAFPGLRIVNGYGPVESLGFTTCHPVTPADLTAPAIPIGTPIAHKGVHVLDDKLTRCPPGVTGELYATGAGLAHGYVGQPGETARRFLPDSYGPPGSRMYRTGDLGQWQPGGTLQITGRADDQVKIRGFRVEPGEVAHALRGHPAVGDCAVVAHEPAPGEPRLAAYLVATASPAPGHAELHEFLGRNLPDYMIPSSVTVLDGLPLTANGKLDRAALPAPALAGAPAFAAAPADARPQPLTDAEVLVADVWAEVLGLPDIGLDDTFFRLGGNSLAAVRVAMRLSERTGTRIPPRLVFTARTVRTLARHLPSVDRSPM